MWVTVASIRTKVKRFANLLLRVLPPIHEPFNFVNFCHAFGIFTRVIVAFTSKESNAMSSSAAMIAALNPGYRIKWSSVLAQTQERGDALQSSSSSPSSITWAQASKVSPFFLTYATNTLRKVLTKTSVSTQKQSVRRRFYSHYHFHTFY